MLHPRLQRVARALRVPLGTIEKDVALGAILAGIAADPLLAISLIFKGGTALKRIYFGVDYRFSEDLDFSTINAPTGATLDAAIARARDVAVASLSADGAFSATVESLVLRDPHPGGQAAYIVRFRFPWHPEPFCPIKIEITPDEPVLLDAASHPILPSSTFMPEGTIRAYALEEIVAEKLRALLQTDARMVARGWSRSRARDYYDLWRIVTAFDATLDPAAVQRILPEKCRIRAVTFAGTASFFTDRLVADARANWNTALEALAPDLPPIETVLRDLPPMLARFLPS